MNGLLSILLTTPVRLHFTEEKTKAQKEVKYLLEVTQ